MVYWLNSRLLIVKPSSIVNTDGVGINEHRVSNVNYMDHTSESKATGGLTTKQCLLRPSLAHLHNFWN